jgi:hypothetical protein
MYGGEESRGTRLTRDEVLTHLMEVLQKARAEWQAASDGDRPATRARFMRALNDLNSVLLRRPQGT